MRASEATVEQAAPADIVGLLVLLVAVVAILVIGVRQDARAAASTPAQA